MSLHSDAMSDHNLLAWLHQCLMQPATHGNGLEGQLPATLAELLDELIHYTQFSSRAVLLQTLLDAHNYLAIKGELNTDITSERAVNLLQAIEGLMLNRNVDVNIALLLELLPAELKEDYRHLLRNEADALGSGTEAYAPIEIATQLSISEESTSHSDAIEADNASFSASNAEATSPQSHSGNTSAAMVTSRLPAEHPLLLMIDLAIEDIAAIPSQSAADPAALSELIGDHLENIAFTAESCGLEAFALPFHKKAEHFRQAVANDPAAVSEQLPTVAKLLTAARLQAASLIDSPAEGGATACDNDSAATATTIAQAAAPDITYSDERLAILAEELRDIEPELISLATILIEGTEQDLLAPLERYGDLMSRLMTVCDALGMEGLKRVVITISDNINLLPTIESSAKLMALPLFVGWPAIIDTYLRDPGNEAGVFGLIDFLQATDWPSPLSGLDSRDLFMLLIEGPSAEEQAPNSNQRQTEATLADVSLEFDPDVNRDLFESFLIEAPELARQFNATISNLGSGEKLLDNLRTAQRMSHTLKGSANLIGIKGIANLAHHTEDILETLARTRTAPPAPLRDALARSGDCLEAMIDAVHGLDTPPEDAGEVMQQILDWANLADRGELDKVPAVPARPGDAVVDGAAAIPAKEEHQEVSGNVDALSSVRVASTTIDDMFRLVEEITISQGQIREQASRLKKLGDVLASHEQILQNRRFNLENLVDIRSIASMQRKAHRQRINMDAFDPLEMDQYDELHAATHSYIEAVADARELNQFVINNISQLDSLLLRQDRLNKELQQIVGATRLVPVSVITSRLERAVRQACRMTQKQASLEIIGRQFLIDGDVLNKLVDPLLHMLRNAVDHGIEFPDERIEQGKSPNGTITLEFRQDGNNIAVSCSDDGRGLDYGRITEVAQRRGLLQQAQQAGHEQLRQLILTPAFTTRNNATQLSGRGIGMDAVQATVTALKGNIAITDKAGGGTEFIIRIPTSLVTNHSLIVRCGSERFAIPTGYLQQILPPGTGRTTFHGDTETFQLGSTFYPLHSLNALLGVADEAPKESKTVLITTGSGRTATAIAVDYVVQSADLVVKGLGKYVHNVPSSIGVSVLGDGQVIPVLDLPHLLSGGSSGQTGNIIDGQLSLPTLDDGGVRRPEVLIVDDSLSVRNTLSQLLSDFGYRTRTARDGVEALEIVRKQVPAIILTDLEMPRMDGMELVRTLRGRSETSTLPIVMITSRTQAKHRSAAEQAGLNAYVTKPFIEEELLDTISALLTAHV